MIGMSWCWSVHITSPVALHKEEAVSVARVVPATEIVHNRPTAVVQPGGCEGERGGRGSWEGG